MTLLEAINIVQDEYDSDIAMIKDDQSDPRAEQIFSQSLQNDYKALEASGLFEVITSNAKFAPEESRVMIRSFVWMAFRLGMRVQRKLSNPDATTRLDWRDQETH